MTTGTAARRKADDPEDQNSYKRLKSPAATPINEPEEACSKGHLVYNNAASRAMSDDKGIVGKGEDSVNEYRFRKDKEAMNKTPAATPIIETNVACNKAHLIYKAICANVALDYYNSKNGTNFELVEDGTLDSYPFSDFSGSWIHCCFTAKEDSSIDKFFAEIEYVHLSRPAVTTCQILEGETKVGCENCHSAVTHPVSGYRGGLPDNSIDASHAMSDKEDCKPTMQIIENAENAICKSPASTTHEPEELSPHVMSDKEDCKIDTGTIEINKDSKNETPAATPINEPKVSCSEAYLLYKTSQANMALEYYNNKYGTKFELVVDEALESYPFAPFDITWIHSCFNAKDESSTKKFFAESKHECPFKLAVTTCMILGGETKAGCVDCPPEVTHPVSGYEAALDSEKYLSYERMCAD